MRKIVFLLAFVLFGVVMAAFAQQDVSKQAAEALANGDYSRAITLYEEITKGDAHNANSWERLGLSYLLDGKYSLAVPAL
jgi:Flp pilus assembly protein TadD